MLLEMTLRTSWSFYNLSCYSFRKDTVYTIFLRINTNEMALHRCRLVVPAAWGEVLIIVIQSFLLNRDVRMNRCHYKLFVFARSLTEIKENRNGYFIFIKIYRRLATPQSRRCERRRYGSILKMRTHSGLE